MLARLRRHPFAVEAWFDFSLVLTYAYPAEVLRPLLPPGLALDAYRDADSGAEWGFLAIALVQVRGLRPAGLPTWAGQDFFLSGYRLFARYTTAAGRRLRGLYILRGDTDRRRMAWLGGLASHYRFAHARRLELARPAPTALALDLRSADGRADLRLTAEWATAPAAPPPGSPFPDLKTARRYAGPLPFTFGYEAGPPAAMVLVEGRRHDWTPRPVHAHVAEAAFLRQAPFDQAPTRLANAFLVEHIPYRWQAGVLDRGPAPADAPGGLVSAAAPL